MVEKTNIIVEYAQSIGFDEVGFASPSILKESAEGLANFVSLGRHGEMSWMERNIERRADPNHLWPDVQSIIVVAANYGPDVNPLDVQLKKNVGAISVYARNRDYHKVLKGRLKQLGSWVAARYGGQLKVFVDTAPVMEKPLAQAAGIGWQGKHTNLVSRQFGSWLFLGVIFTTLSLRPSDGAEDTCGSCRSCLDICPTQAFPEPHQIDARRCISYLTIEYRGVIDREFRRPIGNRIFGCDDCLAICPWNKFAQQTKELKFIARDDLQEPLLRILVRLDDEEFRSYFSQSPVKRIGRERFVRNVLIAIGNSRNPDFVEDVKTKLWDKSKIIRAMAVWALASLVPPSDFGRYRNEYYPDELEFEVRNEWDEAGIV